MDWSSLVPLIITTIVGGIVGFLVSWGMVTLQKQAEGKVQESKEEKEAKEIEFQAMKEACKEMLRKSLKEDLDYFKRLGYCPIEDKADIENTYKIYNKGLKGNGRGTMYYESIMALPDFLEHKEDN
jgi:hypothetical protein